MKTTSFVFLLGFSILGAAGCDNDPTGPSEGVTVYEDPDFRGDARTFDGNAFDLRDIRGPCNAFGGSEGDWNDCISSIRVPTGWEVTIFEDDSYEGDSLTLTMDTPDLDDVNGPCGNDWDDCITAMQVRQR
ncbi:MAG: peptidase inhibitor family I36 protein [Vicinamibacteria bacterium]